jgi:serine phosphatase RsbU (regulator of sigma subunit)
LIDQIEPSKSFEVGSSSSVFNGVRLSTRNMPAEHGERGGDWCETFVLSDDIIGLSIGDVCGHGIEKFAAAVVTRQAVRDAALSGLDPSQTLAAANRFVRDFDPELLSTAFFALLDTRNGTLTFANAGHPPPLLVDPAVSHFLSYAVTDLPLGAATDLFPALHVVSAPEQTLLVLYTDGVTEHDREPIGGESRLLSAARIAYKCWSLPTALIIEELMCLSGSNVDDASILTAWTPPGVVQSKRQP